MNILKYTRLYLIRLWAVHQAKRYLSKKGDTAAAESMYVLNRYAGYTRNRAKKDVIYQMKNHFIREMYRRYPHPVRIHHQTLKCNRCYQGIYYDDYGSDRGECWHCGGTGIYRETTLYLFAFEIGGRTYKWHQPKSLVDFEVTIADDPPEEWENTNPMHVMTTDAYVLARETVRLWLMKQWVMEEDLPERFPAPFTWAQLRVQLGQDWISVSSGYWGVIRKLRNRFWRPVEYRILDVVMCPECKGYGAVHSHHGYVTCPKCHDSGWRYPWLAKLKKHHHNWLPF